MQLMFLLLERMIADQSAWRTLWLCFDFVCVMASFLSSAIHGHVTHIGAHATPVYVSHVMNAHTLPANTCNNIALLGNAPPSRRFDLLSAHCADRLIDTTLGGDVITSRCRLIPGGWRIGRFFCKKSRGGADQRSRGFTIAIIQEVIHSPRVRSAPNGHRRETITVARRM